MTDRDFHRVVILGAQGMLGHALAAIFSDFSPMLLDRADLDITDAVAVKQTFARLKPNCIINTAAATDVDGCETDERGAYAVNAIAVATLGQVAKTLGALIVHYSPDYVFSGSNKSGYREDDETGPINAYGRSKLAGERNLAASGARYLLIRTSWLFGPNRKNFVDAFMAKSEQNQELRVVNDQFGKPTYSLDLARQTRWLIEHGATGVHHATNEGVTTWFDIAKEILRSIGRKNQVNPITLASLKRKAERPVYSILRNTKDRPLRPWQEAVHDYCSQRRESGA